MIASYRGSKMQALKKLAKKKRFRGLGSFGGHLTNLAVCMQQYKTKGSIVNCLVGKGDNATASCVQQYSQIASWQNCASAADQADDAARVAAGGVKTSVASARTAVTQLSLQAVRNLLASGQKIYSVPNNLMQEKLVWRQVYTGAAGYISPSTLVALQGDITSGNIFKLMDYGILQPWVPPVPIIKPAAPPTTSPPKPATTPAPPSSTAPGAGSTLVIGPGGVPAVVPSTPPTALPPGAVWRPPSPTAMPPAYVPPGSIPVPTAAGAGTIPQAVSATPPGFPAPTAYPPVYTPPAYRPQDDENYTPPPGEMDALMSSAGAPQAQDSAPTSAPSDMAVLQVAQQNAVNQAQSTDMSALMTAAGAPQAAPSAPAPSSSGGGGAAKAVPLAAGAGAGFLLAGPLGAAVGAVAGMFMSMMSSGSKSAPSPSQSVQLPDQYTPGAQSAPAPYAPGADSSQDTSPASSFFTPPAGFPGTEQTYSADSPPPGFPTPTAYQGGNFGRRIYRRY